MDNGSKYSPDRLRLPAGQALFETGDPSVSFYVLSRGEVKFQQNGTSIATLSVRDHPLGTADFVLRLPRQYTLVATEEAALKEYDLDPDNFFDWLDDHPLKLDGVIQNYAHLVDHFNRKNEAHFELFRDHRSVTESFVRPFARLISRLEQPKSETRIQVTDKLESLLAQNPFSSLLKSYRRIVNTTGRSSHNNLSEHDVPETSVETYEPDEVICEEGETGDNLYVLINGSLSVLKGSQRLSTIDERGTVFGEMSPALNDRRHATVKSDTKAEVSVIPYERLQYVLEESPDFSHKLVMIFFKRYRRAIKLNHYLNQFLGFMKRLQDSNGLDSELKEYLEDLLTEIESNEFSDDEVNAAARSLREWYIEDVDTFGDQIPSDKLSDFTSSDISY